jgi:hypothetical protein
VVDGAVDDVSTNGLDFEPFDVASRLANSARAVAEVTKEANTAGGNASGQRSAVVLASGRLAAKVGPADLGPNT